MTTASATRSGGNWLPWLALAVVVFLILTGAAMMGEEVDVPAAPASLPATDAADWAELDAAHQLDADDAVAAPANFELPPISIVDTHAFTKHAEAARILQDYDNKDFICLTAYRSLTRNRILIRLRLRWTTLEAGIIIRTSGVVRTIFLAPPSKWDSCLARYEYDPVPFMRIGNCTQPAQ